MTPEQYVLLQLIGDGFVPLWRFNDRLDDLDALAGLSMLEAKNTPNGRLIRLSAKGRKAAGLPPLGMKNQLQRIPSPANDDG